jgi:predicted MFS family arabinose efflux permease
VVGLLVRLPRGGGVTKTPWPKVVLVCAAGLPAAIALGKLAPVGPLVRAELGLSLGQLGWAISAITAVAALLGTPGGAWTRRRGPRRTLVAGLAVMAVAGGAGATARGLGVLLVARVVEGVGYLLVVVAAPDLLVRLTQARPADRSMALAGWSTVIPTGMAVGGAVGGTLAQAIGWRGWLGVTAALALLAAVAVAAAIPTDRSQAAATTWAPTPPPRLRGAGLLGPLLLAGGFCGLCLVGIAVLSLLPSFLVSQRGVGLGEAGLATGLVALASVPGSLAAGWLLRRGAGLRPLAATMLVMPLAALLAFSQGGTATVAVGVAVAGAAGIMLANGVAVAGVFAAVPSLVDHPDQTALAIGLLTQLGSVGTLLGAPLSGSVAATTWSAVAPLVGATTLVSLGLLLAASAQRPRVVAR